MVFKTYDIKYKSDSDQTKSESKNAVNTKKV